MPETENISRRAAWFWGLGIAALALLLRFVYVFQIHNLPLIVPEDLDPGFYYRWAQAIAGGDLLGKDPFVQSPLYAYLLGFWMRLVGQAITPILIAQSIVGTATVALTYVAGRRFFGEGPARWAGILLALYGPFIYYEGMVMKTFLSPFLTILLALLVDRARRLSTSPEGAPGSKAVVAWLCAGLAFGLLTLDRDNFIVLAPVLFLVAMALGGGFNARGLRSAAGLTVGACLAILPVTARNYAASGEVVLLTTGGGEVFFIGNNPDANGLYVPPAFVRPDPKYEHADFIARASEMAGRPLTPMESSWFWFREGAGFIASEPITWLGIVGRKLQHFWNWYELPDNLDYGVLQRFSPLLLSLNGTAPPRSWPTLAFPAGGGASMPVRLHLWSAFGTIAPLGLLGAMLSWKRRRDLLPLYVLLFGYMGTVMLFFNFSRFRVPVVPILALFAGAALMAIGRWLRRLAGVVAALVGRSGDLAARAKSLVPGVAAATVLVLFVGVTLAVNVEIPQGVIPAVEQALIIGNAYYALDRQEEARDSYLMGLVLLGEGPPGPEGDALLRNAFGPGVTSEAIRREVEVESVARGPQFKGIHLGIHHGLGIADLQAAQSLLQQGRRTEAMTRLDRAIGQFQEALKIAPAYLLSHRKMARAYQLRDNTPAAVEWLRKAVDLWPEDLQARLDLAEMLYATRDYREALSQIDQGLHYNPSIPGAQQAQVAFNRGLIQLRGLGDEGRALYDMEKAIALDPAHAQAPAIRATISELRAKGVTPIADEPPPEKPSPGGTATTPRPSPASSGG
ncbi:MAG TPA: glycosyltransferase family 39 protein [Candidatus Polarisedimenticolia bacterium]|nr:glycosyltransferase family 39 protein [Candidatus Polarisedimenticolia bacterium]